MARIGRKRIAEAVRALAAECAAGTAPELGEHFGEPRCAVGRVAERLGALPGIMATEIINYECNISAVYNANDNAPPEKRAAAVVAPLNALADELESAS